MSRAFVLFQLQIDDADGYREYEAADHIAMLKKFDGTFIGADAAAEVLRGAVALSDGAGRVPQ